MNFKKLLLTIFALAIVLGFSYFLTFFGARGGTYTPEAARNDAELAAMLEKSENLENKFLEKQKLGTPSKEDLAVLDDAILTLHSYISISQTQDRQIHSRLAKMRSISQNFKGKSEAEEVSKLAVEADRAFTSQNMLLALELYTKLKERQEKLNTLYPDSEYYDIRSLAKADQMLKLVSAAPLAAEVKDLQKQIDFSIKQKRWNEAQKLIEKAIEKQTVLNRDFSSTSFANFSKIREFEIELDSLKAAPIESEINEAVKNGRDFEKAGDFKSASVAYTQAYEKQKELNQLFEKSRYSSDEKSRQFEKMRDTSLSRELYAQIQNDRKNLDKMLLAGAISDNIQMSINDLLIKCESLKRDYPASTLLSDDEILSLRFLNYLGKNLPDIIKIVDSQLLKIDAASEVKMLKTEVPQRLYQMVMQENPSRNVGDKLPVETVSWENASDFCKRLSWILAKKVTLPSREDYYKAIGLLKYVDLNAISWNAGNSGLKTHNIATSEANVKGFYDLLGNVAEYTSQNKSGKIGIIGGSSQTWTDSLGEIPCEQADTTQRGDRMVGFRFIVDK